MNILWFYPEENSHMGQWQKTHIFDELKRNGHKIHLFNPLLYPTYEQANEELINHIKKSNSNFDLFVNSLGSEHLFPDTVVSIKKFEIKTILICYDNLHAPFMHRKIAPHFDLVWLTSKETMGMFKLWGCKNIIFQTYAANPYYFIPNWTEQIHSVGFVGSPYGSRINKINKLTLSGVDFNLYSNTVANEVHKDLKKNNNDIIQNIRNFDRHIIQTLSFNIGRKLILGALINKSFYSNSSKLKINSFLHLNPSVSDEEMINVYANCALSLNVTELRNTYVLKNPIHKIHLRTFEIPMCGGLALTSYSDELSEYFEDEKEIIFYKSDEEFISKAKFYLNSNNDSLCMKMKINARKRAESEHTWMNRFNVIFNNISNL